MKRKPKVQEQRDDGWQNFSTGLGTRRDKVRHHRMHSDPILDPETLSALFHHSDTAQRIAKTLVEDAMRQGFSYSDQGDEAEAKQAQALNNALLKKWAVHEKMVEADIWGRHFGAGFILLGVVGAGASLKEPLDDAKVRRGGLKFLSVYDRRDVVIESYEKDQLAATFNEPMTYRVHPIGSDSISVHATRMIKFGGSLTAKQEKLFNGGFDHSVMQRVYAVLQESQSNWQGIVHLMTDMGQGVFKIDGLRKIISAKGTDAIQTRMALLDESRSLLRALLLDKDEDFERKPTPITGAAEILMATWQRVAAAAEMPVTVLMGMSPSGMNATGESDTRMWYDRVQEHREKIIGPRLDRLARIIAASEGISGIDGLQLCWPSLWQQTPAQEADTRLKVAQADALHIDKGMALPEEKAISRWGKGKYSSETQIDLAVREKARDAELGKLEENAGKPDPVPPPALPPGSPAAEPPEPPAP